MTRQQILLGIFALISAASLTGTIMVSGKAKAQHTIRISLLGTSEDEDYDGAMVLKRYVESRSDGRVKVELYPSGQFCSTERECLESLQSGVLQVFMFTTGGFGSVYGPAQVLDLPYAFRDDAIAECVLDGPIADELSQTILDAKIGIRLMTVSNTGGWRNFATTDQPIHSPDDVIGRKIRTITAPLQQELVRQLGGNPTPIAWSEVYTALATGVVDGTKNGIHDIVSMQLHEQIKFVTLDGHAYMGGLWWYSESSWQQLPEEFKPIVLAGFQALKKTTRDAIKRWEGESYAKFRESGGTLFVPGAKERTLFRDAVKGMRKWYTDTYGSSWLERLDAEVLACESDANRNL
jgi:tripartite ATP-independent transporter DctP family solute receptor